MNALRIVARMHNDFPTKFGIPRQSNLVAGTRGSIVFEPEYRNPDALRGLEEFSHIWLLWGFSGTERDTWSPTVRPPRLGGNTRMGVFATRSPFRPNAIGLSSVRIDSIESHPEWGPVIHVLGADLMDGTPIYDIKPYLPFTDSHPDATGGFAEPLRENRLQVVLSREWASRLPEPEREILTELLAQDPRPSYQQDPRRMYGMEYGKYEVKFTVDGDTLTVREIAERSS